MSWSVGAFQIPLGILTDAAGLRAALRGDLDTLKYCQVPRVVAE